MVGMLYFWHANVGVIQQFKLDLTLDVRLTRNACIAADWEYCNQSAGPAADAQVSGGTDWIFTASQRLVLWRLVQA